MTLDLYSLAINKKYKSGRDHRNCFFAIQADLIKLFQAMNT